MHGFKTMHKHARFSLYVHAHDACCEILIDLHPTKTGKIGFS